MSPSVLTSGVVTGRLCPGQLCWSRDTEDIYSSQAEVAVRLHESKRQNSAAGFEWKGRDARDPATEGNVCKVQIQDLIVDVVRGKVLHQLRGPHCEPANTLGR